MTLSDLSIRRPVFAWMLMAGLILFGGISFLRMGISQFPNVDFPVVSVNVRLEGAAPEVIETAVVDIIENAVMGVEGIRDITSESETSEGTVTIEFDLDRNIDSAVQDVQAKVDSILQKLPKDITAPRISKSNPEDVPVMMLTLRSDRCPLPTLMEYVSGRVQDRFSTVAGVGNITLGGYRDPNLRVWVSPAKLGRYSLTVDDVINTIQTQHVEAPAGELEDGTTRYNIRTLGEAVTPQDFAALRVLERGGQPNYSRIHLGQVARVEEGMADATSMSRAMGVPDVVMNIMKQPGANAVTVADAVRARVAEVQKGLPPGMELGVVFDGSRYIRDAVHELDFTLLLSALLTALVCWMFLGSWSSTLNVLLAIPTSVIGSFTVLYFAGFTLNTFTLLGLSLSIGIVVDDAIMVLENIVRHREKGRSRYGAALVGAREITFAAVAATVALVAIFLPVAFIHGVIGRFFFQFGVTITVAVLLSLLEALTLTPMRCAQFVDVGARRTRLGRGMEALLAGATAAYARTLAWALEHRWAVLLGSLAVSGAAFATLAGLNKEFLPAADENRFMVRLKTPIGSSLPYSNEKFKAVEAFLGSRPEVDRYVMQVGGGSPGDSSKGWAMVTLKEPSQRGVDPALGHAPSQQEFMQTCRGAFKAMPGVRAVIQDLSARAFTGSRGFPVEFKVQGPDWDRLAGYTAQLSAALEATGLVTDLDSDYDLGQPELRIVPDRDKAAASAVSMAKIATTIDAMVGGVVVGSYEKGGHRYDIRVKMEDGPGSPQAKLAGLFVRNNRGERIPLSALVDVRPAKGLISIWRSNRERAITVDANVKPGRSQQDALRAVQDLARRLLPPDYHVTLSGSSQTFGDAFRSLLLVLLLGVLVSYMVLGTQFDSFIDPLSVLLVLPFSVAGALVALYGLHQSLNLYSVIGLILLMGIVKKNSILLVDFSNQAYARGRRTVDQALLEACPLRLRPILMTSVATVAGAVPAALALGPGAESRMPMAIGIIGGVLFSLPLTLYVVPCFHSLMAPFGKKREHAARLAAALKAEARRAGPGADLGG